MFDLLYAALGITMGRSASLVPGFSPMLMALVLRGMSPVLFISAYITLSLAGAVRDAMRPDLSGSTVLSAVNPSSQDVSSAYWRKLQGLVVGLTFVWAGANDFGAGLGWVSLAVLAWGIWSCRGKDGLGAIALVCGLGGLALYLAQVCAAPQPVLAIGLGVYALPAAMRAYQGVTPLSDEGQMMRPRVWLAGALSGILPGVPGGFMSQCFGRNPTQASTISGLEEGIALALLAAGGTPRTGAAIEMAASANDLQLVWWAAAFAVAISLWRWRALERASLESLKSPLAVTTALVLNAAALGLAAGLYYTPIVVALGYAANRLTRNTPALKGLLLSAPAFAWL